MLAFIHLFFSHPSTSTSSASSTFKSLGTFHNLSPHTLVQTAVTSHLTTDLHPRFPYTVFFSRLYLEWSSKNINQVISFPFSKPSTVLITLNNPVFLQNLQGPRYTGPYLPLLPCIPLLTGFHPHCLLAVPLPSLALPALEPLYLPFFLLEHYSWSVPCHLLREVSPQSTQSKITAFPSLHPLPPPSLFIILPRCILFFIALTTIHLFSTRLSAPWVQEGFQSCSRLYPQHLD